MGAKKRLLNLMVVLYSLVNIIVGFALVLLSVAFVSTGYAYLEPREKTALLYVLSFGTTIVGLFTTICGILGFLGAVCRSPCLLAITATLLLVPLGASIYISNKETSALRISVQDQIEEIFIENYGTQEHLTVVVDLIQSTFKCCGVKGPADWSDSVYNAGNTTAILRVENNTTHREYLIPPSCCRTKRRCSIARNITMAKNFTPSKRGIFPKGCATMIDDNVKFVLSQAEVILLSDAALDVFGIFCIWILFLVLRHDIAKEEGEGPRTNV